MPDALPQSSGIGGLASGHPVSSTRQAFEQPLKHDSIVEMKKIHSVDVYFLNKQNVACDENARFQSVIK